jgi:hypothetical protein
VLAALVVSLRTELAQARAELERARERIAELDRPPTIAVLCSCQSAGKGDESLASDDGALSALGPRLAGAGVAQTRSFRRRDLAKLV